LQQRAQPKSCFYGSASKEISELTRQSGITGKRNPLFYLVLGPVINGNTTAAIRMLFDWLVVGQVMPSNPASSVRGPKHVVKTGKTPVLEADAWRRLIDSIPTDTVRDLRDRALIAILTYGFARITAALKMKVEDLRPRGAAWVLRLHEKGGKHHVMPCHHAAAEALHAYIAAAGIAEDKKGWLFRTAKGHRATVLSDKPMDQADAWCGVAPKQPASWRRSAITASEQPALPPISPTAGRWSTRRPWPRMRARARSSCMTGRRNA
jgi:integrase